MRVLDPRLYQRARAVRTLLVVDSVLAVVVALLVLAQAFLLARVAARAFGGSSLDDVAPALVLLGLVVIARAAGAWGFEVAGRRAAAEVVSQLRLDVVDARLRRRPAALDGTQTSEVTTAAVTGVDALEATFARYLPQIVLAAVVPIAVLAIVVSIDPLAAGVMVLTLPLVPVFMWLVGRQTARKARERWQALALLSNHFLDVVRGLPTLRAFNRGAVQAERIASVSDEYRTTTMGTLRLAFLSGAILELAATLGIALVAVVVGVRLAEGNIGFEAALTVLVLAPELYLPIRNLAAQWHASADGAAVAERLLDLSEAPAHRGRVGSSFRVRRSRRSCSSGSRTGTRHVSSTCFATSSSSSSRARQLRSSGRAAAGKSTLLSLLMRFAEPSSGRIRVGERQSREPRSEGMATPHGLRATAPDALPGDHRRQHQARRARCSH